MMVFKKRIPRRTFLRGAGAALALPLLDGMIPAFAGPADLGSKPLIRMGFMMIPTGAIMNKWTPATEGANFEMTQILEPLTPFRNRLLVLTGMDQKHANAEPGEGGAFHSRASSCFLTGVHPKATEGADIHCGVSVDQVAAKQLAKFTQLASLEISLDPTQPAGVCEPGYSCAYENTISWRSPTVPMPMEDKPRAIFERLFGDSDTTDSAARLARVQENRSVLDFVTQDARAHLTKELGSRDRAKLSEYLDAVRDVERRVQLAEEQSSRELPTLERPDSGVPATYGEYAKLMFDLQVLAYQTDLTRVISFAFGRESNNRTYREIGVPDAHHPLTHHRGDPVSMAKVAMINSYHVKLFAYYLEKLQSTPDGDGSLLDHTMIAYGSGISDGNGHTNENLPILLVGGGAGKIKGGRHLRLPSGTPLNNLYLSMLNMAGIPLDNLGDSTGKLEGLSVA